MSEYIYRSNGEPLMNDNGEISLALAGEIVRCRNCQEYHPELYKHISCELLGRNVEPNGFCAWGVRAVCQNEHGHNSRAKRTCSVMCITDGLIMDEPNSIELSCGHTFETWDEVPPNYCPECGAQVQTND